MTSERAGRRAAGGRMVGRSWIVLCIALAVLAPAGRGALASECPPQSEASLDTYGSSWDALYRHYLAFARCDDGTIAEGFSDAVMGLLARSWDSLPHLAAIVKGDGEFRAFVLRHVDGTAGDDLLRIVRERARNACPSDHGRLCKDIRAAVDRALGGRAAR